MPSTLATDLHALALFLSLKKLPEHSEAAVKGANRIEELEAKLENHESQSRAAMFGAALEKMEARCRRLEAKLVEIANRLPGGHPDRAEIVNVVMEGE